MTVSTQSMEIEIPRPTPLLRRNKYYIKAANGECANCKLGKHGCCAPYLRIERDDFQMDFTSIEDVRALLATKLFVFNIELRTHYDFHSAHASIRIRGRNESKKAVCVFWTDKGCRLAYNIRPKVCRKHRCHVIDKDSVEVNKRDKKRTGEYRRKRFTRDDIKTMLLGVLEYDNKQFMHGNEYSHLDWDLILLTL